ncbi:autophagy-related protein 13-domain-containing protein [Lentinula edodes]|nr:autophagy-related protein 13-domain-containing protein [Lentinula edodes]
MSHDAQKADQITFHFYTKLFYVLNDARATIPAEIASARTDKWFNLETPDSDLWTKEGREPYKTISALRPLPPLEIQVLLTVPDSLTNNQVLVYISPDSSRVPIQSTYRYVLLERWVLELSSRDIYSFSSDSESSSGSVSLSTLYKHGIPLFRSLYSFLRVLPAWKLSKRFRRRRHNGMNGLGVQVRVRGDPGSGLDEVGVMPFNSSPALPTSTHTFPSIQHPIGTLNLTTTYLTSPNFRVDELESLLSSRFMSMDTGGTKGMEFTPTLVKNQQRDSLLSSAGGSPGTRNRLASVTGASAPHSPPRDILRRPSSPPQPYAYSHSRTPSDADSIAERFVISSRTVSNPSNPTNYNSNPPPPPINAHNYPILPITRATTTTSTSTQPPSGIAARLRRESLGNRNMVSDSYLPLTTTGSSTQPFPSSSSSISSITGGTGSSAPPTTTLLSSPMAMRRPGLNPFKSNTLAGAGSTTSTSGSPRLTNALPGATGSGLALGAGVVSSSPLGPGSAGLTSLSSLSNLSNLPRRPSSPSSLSRPSPPSFTPSSIGPASNSTGSGSITIGAVGTATAPLNTATGEIAVPRKRYSSSFGHRYSSSPARGGAAMSVGSQGSQGGSGIVEGTGVSNSGAGVVVGSLGQTSVRSGMSGMSAMSIHSGQSAGSGSTGGVGSNISGIGTGREGLVNIGRGIGATPDSAHSSTYPDFHDTLDGQDLFSHDHDDISTFVHDIDSRKPLIGRSRMYADANMSRNNTEGNEVESEDDERQRTIRVRARDDSRERLALNPSLNPSPFSREADLPQDPPTASRGAGSSSTRSGVVKTPPSSRRASYTGLSPPSSPLRNAIPLIAEDEDDQIEPSANAPIATSSSAVATLSTSPSSQAAPLSSVPSSADPGSSNAATGAEEGSPSSPPQHSSPMLTTASDVEARLKKMNDVFLASLQGLGGRSLKGRNDKGKERRGSGTL